MKMKTGVASSNAAMTLFWHLGSGPFVGRKVTLTYSQEEGMGEIGAVIREITPDGDCVKVFFEDLTIQGHPVLYLHLRPPGNVTFYASEPLMLRSASPELVPSWVSKDCRNPEEPCEWCVLTAIHVDRSDEVSSPTNPLSRFVLWLGSLRRRK